LFNFVWVAVGLLAGTVEKIWKYPETGKVFVPRVASPDPIRSMFSQFRGFPQLSNFLKKLR
jgi:hypothetical protein